MVKINFSDITVYTDIGKTLAQRVDIRKEVANDLYKNGTGIAFHALALKIYNGEGEQEFSDEEYSILMNYVRQMGTPMMIDAFENLGNNNNNNLND